jgi:hypothetical protein
VVIDIVYRIAGHEGVIGSGHPLWHTSLPALGRSVPSTPAPSGPESENISHADYFQAVRAYLVGPGQAHIQKAMAAHPFAREADFPSQGIEIVLEKHGEFYHPARILLPLGKGILSLALNVAVAPAGKTWMASEIAALGRVSARLPEGSVPRCYGQAVIPGPGNHPLAMFLADWFEGFHEFHLSIDPHDGRPGMVVWDTTEAPFYLSPHKQADVYRQTAFLLTRAYNPLTSEQIYPWHHASGDFVLRTRGNGVELRLITVRQYAPTMGAGQGELDQEARLIALMVFFLNLTVRNRIDRLDGTGPPAWADAAAVPATVKGFFDALAVDQASEFETFLEAYRVDELTELLAMVADRYALMPMEKDLIHANLAPHAALLYETLQKPPQGG